MFAGWVKRLVISFINLPAKGCDYRVDFTPGNITKRVIKIPPIHTIVAKICIIWFKVKTTKFIWYLLVYAVCKCSCPR